MNLGNMYIVYKYRKIWIYIQLSEFKLGITTFLLQLQELAFWDMFLEALHTYRLKCLSSHLNKIAKAQSEWRHISSNHATDFLFKPFKAVCSPVLSYKSNMNQP